MKSSFLAYRITDAERSSAGRVETITPSDLPAGDLLVRVRFASINYKDALGGLGRAPVVRRFPLIGGLDLAGEVVRCDSGRFQPGDSVIVHGYGLAVDHDGGYAEYWQGPAEWAVRLPQGLTMQEAMALGSAGFTAAFSLLRLEQNGIGPASGDLVITGATGGVGSLALSLASRLGYRTIAISGKADAHEYLHNLGAQEIWPRSVVIPTPRALEKPLFAAAIDTVGGQGLAWLLASTAPYGAVVSFGVAGGSHLETSLMPFLLRGVSLIGISSANCPQPLREEIWARLAGEWKVAQLPAISQEVCLEDLNNCFTRMLDGQIRGRIVVRLPN